MVIYSTTSSPFLHVPLDLLTIHDVPNNVATADDSHTASTSPITPATRAISDPLGEPPLIIYGGLTTANMEHTSASETLFLRALAT